MTQHNIAFLTAGIFVGLLVGVAVTLILSSSSKSSETMKLEFGIRMTREDGVSIFGVDEIQARLEDGAAITALQCTGAKF